MLSNFFSYLYMGIWPWAVWKFIAVFSLSLWGVSKGRSACILITVAAIFMLLNDTDIIHNLKSSTRDELSEVARNDQVCVDRKTKKPQADTTESTGQDASPLPSDNKNNYILYDMDYESCINTWVANTFEMRVISSFRFMINFLGELIQALAFLVVFAMLRDREVKRLTDVIRWYWIK